MNPIVTEVIPKNSGKAFVLQRGQRIRIEARSIVDFVAFNRDNLKERFDQARTKTNQAKIFISTGDHLFSKLNNVMLTILADTFKEGRHDLQKGMCSRKRFEMVARGVARRDFVGGVDPNPKAEEDIPDHGCWENLSAALAPWKIEPEDIPSPFNIFQAMEIDSKSGRMLDTFIRPQDGTYVELRAEMHCLIGVSACPESGRGQAVRTMIFDR